MDRARRSEKDAWSMLLLPVVLHATDNFRISRAGLPATTENGGTSRVTTEHAPITAPSLIVTPFRMLALNPIHTLSAITTGACGTRVQSLRPLPHCSTSFLRYCQSTLWES